MLFCSPLLSVPNSFLYALRRAYASVNSSCAHPPHPGNCGAFACLVSPGGGALANLARPGGRAFAYPRAFDTHGVSDSKSKHGGFYRKRPAVRRRLDRPLRTGQTCGGFSILCISPLLIKAQLSL